MARSTEWLVLAAGAAALALTLVAWAAPHRALGPAQADEISQALIGAPAAGERGS